MLKEDDRGDEAAPKTLNLTIFAEGSEFFGWCDRMLLRRTKTALRDLNLAYFPITKLTEQCPFFSKMR